MPEGESERVGNIVRAHGTKFSDALGKLQGLARYAAMHSSVYRRVAIVACLGPDQFAGS